ncbi:hypothetical protein [Salinispora vitiensis]|uniref:hypothetical protein n=1 Tax=Salinispora vitiensis TaxID=999544 RepID=UPI00035FB9A4|nr:hypothetical protein [Salinispora vitiensis]
MTETLTAETVWQLMDLDIARDPVIAVSGSLGACAVTAEFATAAGMAVIASRVDIVARWGDGPITERWCQTVADELAARITGV